MEDTKVARPPWGRPLRISTTLAEQVQDLADRANLPFAFVAAELIRHSLEDEPDWLRSRERYQRRLAKTAPA